MNRRRPAFERPRPRARHRTAGVLAAAAASALLAACGSLFAPGPPAPHFYTLDATAPIAAPPRVEATASAGASAPVMVVALPRAAAGFDTDRIVYVLEAHRLQPYADSQWIDTPSKMLAPLISEALSRSGAFGAVLTAPSPATGQWELQSDIVRFQHEVVSARFHFTLRVALIDKATRTVVLTRELDASAPVAGASPAAAVAAANIVVADVLQQMAMACAGEVARRR
jgi:cholesterol transport system auxiliary component